MMVSNYSHDPLLEGSEPKTFSEKNEEIVVRFFLLGNVHRRGEYHTISFTNERKENEYNRRQNNSGTANTLRI